MKLRGVGAALAAACLAIAVPGVANADDQSMFVDIASPVDGATFAPGESIEASGSVGDGTGEDWRVAIVVDYSGSTLSWVGDGANAKQIHAHELDGARALYTSLKGSRSNLDTALVFFGSDTKTLGPSDDPATVERWLNESTYDNLDVWGSTNCAAAVDAAVATFQGFTGNKRIYFITDGMCNSASDATEAAQRARNQGIGIYSVHTTTGSEECQTDDLSSDRCIYREDASSLADTLPSALGAEVTQLTLTLTLPDGSQTVKDITDVLGTGVVENWSVGDLTTVMGISELPVGTSTLTAVASASDGSQVSDTATFTVAKNSSPAPSPSPSVDPVPSTDPAPAPSTNPAPAPSTDPAPAPSTQPSTPTVSPSTTQSSSAPATTKAPAKTPKPAKPGKLPRTGN